MPKRKTPRTDTDPFRPTRPELPWDSLAYIWSKDKTLREIPYVECPGDEWLVGYPDKEFAILTPSDKDGTIHMQERSYRGRTEGLPRYDVPTRDMLKCQLGIAAAAARGRDIERRHHGH